MGLPDELSEALAGNVFYCFPSVTECLSFRCSRKWTSCQKTFKFVNRKKNHSIWSSMLTNKLQV